MLVCRCLFATWERARKDVNVGWWRSGKDLGLVRGRGNDNQNILHKKSILIKNVLSIKEIYDYSKILLKWISNSQNYKHASDFSYDFCFEVSSFYFIWMVFHQLLDFMYLFLTLNPMLIATGSAYTRTKSLTSVCHHFSLSNIYFLISFTWMIPDSYTKRENASCYNSKTILTIIWNISLGYKCVNICCHSPSFLSCWGSIFLTPGFQISCKIPLFLACFF